jgi:hypothetical protein
MSGLKIEVKPDVGFESGVLPDVGFEVEFEDDKTR